MNTKAEELMSSNMKSAKSTNSNSSPLESAPSASELPSLHTQQQQQQQHSKNEQMKSQSQSQDKDKEYNVYLQILTKAATAAVLSIGMYTISTNEDILHILWMIPVLGLLLYMGLISGYIPSPLYNRGDVWPRQYAILQLVLILSTALRLTGKYEYEHTTTTTGTDFNDVQVTVDIDIDDDEEEDYQNDLKELTQFTNWMGTNLHTFFFKEDGLEDLIEVIGEAVLWFIGSVMLSYLVDHSPFETLRKIDETNYLSKTFVFIRNLLLLFAINLYFIHTELSDDEGTMNNYCHKEYSITPGLIAPDYPFSTLASDFASAWKIFHPSYLTLVRLSHSILYPSIILLLTKRRLTHYFIWLMFIEIDIFHMLADMFHYVSGPELAEDRLEFQGQETDCYVNVQFWQTMLAYPLNFVYLTTSLGDTSESTMNMDMDNNGMVNDVFNNSTAEF